MLLAAAVSALSLVSAVVAQAPVVIQVGAEQTSPGGIFQFNPPSVNATNGTVITFRFTGVPGNHSVTQSTFTDPCDPTPGGFDSGWVFIPTTGLASVPEWNLTITNDSKPLWFFCKQLQPQAHCVAGMVGAINAPTSGANTFSAFQGNAKNFKGTPGQGEGSLVGIGASASAGIANIPSGAMGFTAAPLTVSGSVTPSATAPPSGSTTGSGSPAPTSGASSIVASMLSAAIAAIAGFAML